MQDQMPTPGTALFFGNDFKRLLSCRRVEQQVLFRAAVGDVTKILVQENTGFTTSLLRHILSLTSIIYLLNVGGVWRDTLLQGFGTTLNLRAMHNIYPSGECYSFYGDAGQSIFMQLLQIQMLLSASQLPVLKKCFDHEIVLMT